MTENWELIVVNDGVGISSPHYFYCRIFALTGH